MRKIFIGTVISIMLLVAGNAYAEYWYPVSGYLRPITGSYGLRMPSLLNCDTIDTDGSGNFACGTDETGAGAGDVSDVGNCTGGACFDGTSDGGTQLLFYDAQGATTLVGGNTAGAITLTLPNTTGTLVLTTENVATATALASNPTDCAANQFAQSIVASGNLTCAAISDADVPDNITISLAATATALAANGGNCNAGEYPLGVDASGAVESCTDATTEINTVVATKDECSEITNCVPSAWDALTDMVLTDTYIYVGNASNDPVGVAMSGEASITNLGAVSVLAMEGVDFGTMTDTKVCTYDLAGTEIDCATTMTPDQVGTLTNTKWCTTDGSVVNCATNAPVLTEVDPTVDSEAEIEAIMGIAFGASKVNTSGYIWVADGTDFESVAMSGDVTIASGGATTIGANKILETMLKAVDEAADEECLTYETTTGDFEWQTCGAGSTAYDDIGDPDAATTIVFDNDEVIFYETAEDTGAFLYLKSTDADLSGDTILLTLGFQQATDANQIYLQCKDNLADVPAVVFQIGADGNTTIGGTLNVTGAITGALTGNASTASDLSGCTDCLNATEIEDIYLLDDGDVGTGVYDFGGATSLEIPNGGPTVDTTGEIGIDTTTDQFLYMGASVKRIMSYTNEICVALEDPVDADDNIPFFFPRQAITITDVYCQVDGGTSVAMVISDGTNALESITCDGDGAEDDGSIANGTFTSLERMEFDLDASSGTNTWLNICVTYTYTAD